MSGWKNTQQGYGRITIMVHWLSALTVFSLFGVGLYMMSLSYYDPLYRTLPWWHKSFGLTLLAVTVFRIIWKAASPTPAALPEHGKWTVRLAKLGHSTLYLLLIAIMLTGYLISTADGRGIPFFGWFEVPAFFDGFEGQEDLAGELHFYLAWGLVIAAAGHGLAAIKHHLIDKDKTLTRMIKTGE
ncbi:cytochrome b [Endozoicomonas sp. OPT23]|uniref:cytochrome b n=1 Tax=Endozoicomonas sp. OPT23 TaxID=2072845 RepID=UPI00129BE17A|nr:cytochrome b [Endozoicomonas sp. OPT23]MRI35489.1 cytochrome b [Endozoicomonas sp. OPT23]